MGAYDPMADVQSSFPGAVPPTTQPGQTIPPPGFGQRVRQFFAPSSLTPQAGPGTPGAPGAAQPPQGAPQAAAQQGPPVPGQGDRDMARAMLAMNQFAPQEQAIQRQQVLADKLRGQAPGMMRSSSSIATPNWAGALAGALGGIKANMMDTQAQQDAQTLAGRKSSAYEKFFGPGGFQ